MSLSASQILAISIDRPERLFDPSEFEAQFSKFRIAWHPDKCKDPQASDVFAHISNLYKVAQKHDKNKSWLSNAELVFSSNNKTYKFKYLKMHTTDIGKMYIGHKKVVMVFDKTNNDLFTAAHRAIDGVKLSNPKMKDEFERFLPTKKYRKFNADIGSVLLIDKTPDVVNLKDVLAFMPGNKLDPKHVAWIISSTMNILAFLEYSNKCHNAITSESIFISPEYHSVCLLGGWGFATSTNSPIKAVPSKLRPLLPAELFVDKIAKPKYDQYGLKALAIECLGDPSLIGSRLLMDKNIPKPMINWLRQPPSSDSAVTEYSQWMDVLHESFGKRKFFEFTTDLTSLYKEQ